MSLSIQHINENTLIKEVNDRRLTRIYHPPYESFLDDIRYMFGDEVFVSVSYTKTYIRLSDNKIVTRKYEYKRTKGPKFIPFTQFELEYIKSHSIEDCVHWFKKSASWVRGVRNGTITRKHV